MLQEVSPFTASPHLADGQLIADAKAGDSDALEELIQRSWGPCMRVAKSLLRSPDDVADVLQNAFCRAFIHLGGFRGQAQFSTWVTRIVINQCMMRLRSSQCAKVVSYDQKPGGLDRFCPGERPFADPEEELGNRQVAKALRLELSRLPSFFRAPLELYYLDGLDLEDVALRLNVTVMAVKSRLHRGRKQLKDRMLRHCGERGGMTLLRATKPGSVSRPE